MPNPAKFPSGCKFHTRCTKTRELAAANAGEVITIGEGKDATKVMRICAGDEPNLREVYGAHWAACHFAENYPSSQPTQPSLDHRREVVPEVLDAAEGVSPDIEIMQETRE